MCYRHHHVYCDPSSDVPSSGDPSSDVPSSGVPSSGDPSSGDPSSGDPSSGDPSSGDPSSGDPSSGDPSSDDPSSGDPSSDDPSSDDPSSNDPHSLARSAAYRRVKGAIDKIKEPLVLMQYFAQGKDSLEFSSCLLHRWPSDDRHADFRLEWASAHIADEVRKLLQDTTWQEILKRLVTDIAGNARGPMFELYVRHILRKGGCEFEIKDLDHGTLDTLVIPQDKAAKLFKDIPPASAKSAGTLYIPKICNYACVDLPLAPRDLLQVTVSSKHPIKGPPFKDLINDLIQKHWIDSPGAARLIFVIPSENGDNFRAQKYLNAKGDVYQRLPSEIQPVKQYVLTVDLRRASLGGSPGKRGPSW